MTEKYRVLYSKWFILPLLAVVIGMFSVPLIAKPEAQPVDKIRKVLLTRIERALLGYDVNMGLKHVIDYYYSPKQAMSTYQELLLWHQGNPHAKDTGRDVLGIVREGMIALVRDSGAGLPLLNWQGSGQPISMAYMRFQPRYQEIPDYANPKTLKWAKSTVNIHAVTPGDIGRSLAVKALMIQMDRSDAGLRNAPLFLASALQELEILSSRLFITQRLVQEVNEKPALGAVTIKGKEGERSVRMQLAATLKGVGASSSSQSLKWVLGSAAKGAYVPEVVMPDTVEAWQVKDSRSVLISQVFLLQGLSRLYRVLAMSDVIEPLFDNGKVQGKDVNEWQKLTRRIMDTVYSSLLTNHFDRAAGSFAGVYRKSKGGRSGTITLEGASHLVAALETLISALPRRDPVALSARKHLLYQAAYINKTLNNKQGMPRGLLLENGAHLRTLMRDFSYPVAAMSIMLVAKEIAGDGRYRDEITKLYESTHETFWAKSKGIYRAAEGAKVSAYDGVLFGNVISWLRRMALFSPEVADFDKQVRDIIQVVLKDAGLLQGEGPSNGEPRTPEDFIMKDVPAFVDSLKDVKASELSTPIQNFIQHAVDQDGDGSPGCRFAGGKYGAAPVIVMQVGVSTPFDLGAGGRNGRGAYGF